MTEYAYVTSQPYAVYSDVATADEYMFGDPNFDTWDALAGDAKARYLIAATRTLDRQRWKGDKTSDSQELEWPRTSTGVDGVTDSVVPQNIIDASIRMAYQLSQGGDFESSQNQSQKISSLKAGSVSLSYFRGAEGRSLRFPLDIWELLRDYLEGPSSTLVVQTSGADGETITDEDYGYTEGI